MKRKKVDKPMAVCGYSTSQIASAAGVHPNTVRFYEEMGLLPPIKRKPNGYRVFEDWHLDQLMLIRTGFQSVILASKLREMVIAILKTTASGEMHKGLTMTKAYRKALAAEQGRAKEAIQLAKCYAVGRKQKAAATAAITRGEAAAALGVTTDVFRNWERNGLVTAQRTPRGKPRYGPLEMERLKIIRILHGAHYSTMAILRMLTQLDEGEQDVERTIDTPEEDEDIVGAADRYISALTGADADARKMLAIIQRMIRAAI